MAADEISRGIVRWLARLTGAGSLAFMLIFVAAHISAEAPGPAPTAAEWIGLMCFPAGIIVGLSIAFFQARVGALIAIGSLAAFHVWHLVHAGDLPRGPYFLLLTAPAVLFLISSLLDASPPPRKNMENREPGPSEENPEEPGCGLGTAS